MESRDHRIIIKFEGSGRGSGKNIDMGAGCWVGVPGQCYGLWYNIGGVAALKSAQDVVTGHLRKIIAKSMGELGCCSEVVSEMTLLNVWQKLNWPCGLKLSTWASGASCNSRRKTLCPQEYSAHTFTSHVVSVLHASCNVGI